MNESLAKRGIYLIFITLLMDTIGIAIVAPILPSLLHEITGEEVRGLAVVGSWLVVTYALMQFLFAPLIGMISDRYGRRPVLLISIFTFGLDNLICALAGSYWVLLLGRTLSGISGASFTTCSAYIADVSNDQNRTRNFAIIEIAFGIGFVVGPLIGGILGAYNVRLPFYAAMTLAFVNFILSWFLLPETLPPEKRRKINLLSANPVGSLWRLSKYPLVLGIVAVDFFYTLSFNVWPSQWPYISSFRYDWSEMYIGLSYTVFAIGQLIMMIWVLPKFIKHMSEKKILLIGLIFLALSYLGYALAATQWLVFIVFAFTLFEFFVPAPLRAFSAAQVSPQFQGEVQGAISSLRSLTTIIIQPVYAYVFEIYTAPSREVTFGGAPFILAFIFGVLALLVYITYVYKLLPDHVLSTQK